MNTYLVRLEDLSLLRRSVSRYKGDNQGTATRFPYASALVPVLSPSQITIHRTVAFESPYNTLFRPRFSTPDRRVHKSDYGSGPATCVGRCYSYLFESLSRRTSSSIQALHLDPYLQLNSSGPGRVVSVPWTQQDRTFHIGNAGRKRWLPRIPLALTRISVAGRSQEALQGSECRGTLVSDVHSWMLLTTVYVHLARGQNGRSRIAMSRRISPVNVGWAGLHRDPEPTAVFPSSSDDRKIKVKSSVLENTRSSSTSNSGGKSTSWLSLSATLAGAQGQSL
ncbi:hypothetical protein PM082_016614 [Marasmius tenuissimus]|nr:hypothetical protein PM082_016614 [Marasmius tenuissimus]